MAKSQVERSSTSDGLDQINVSGELGAQSVPGLLRKSRGWFDNANSVRVNLAKVKRTDSAGVAMLLDWWRQSQASGTQIQYVNAPAQMLDIIRFCALDDVLPLA